MSNKLAEGNKVIVNMRDTILGEVIVEGNIHKIIDNETMVIDVMGIHLDAELTKTGWKVGIGEHELTILGES